MRFCQEEGCQVPCKIGGNGVVFHLCPEHYGIYKRRKNRESYQRHKAKRVAEATRWQTNNPKRYKARQARLRARASAKETERLRSKQRYAEDPLANRQRVRRYEHRQRAAAGTYTEEQWQARIDFYGRRCYLCGCDWDALPSKQKHVEHVIPLSRGGINWPSNLRPACESCNLRKSTKLLDLTLAA